MGEYSCPDWAKVNPTQQGISVQGFGFRVQGLGVEVQALRSKRTAKADKGWSRDCQRESQNGHVLSKGALSKWSCDGKGGHRMLT
eukprot:1092881-Rhodomonas_salina.1